MDAHVLAHCSSLQVLVWKELNYGHMSEKEKQLVVSEVCDRGCGCQV